MSDKVLHDKAFNISKNSNSFLYKMGRGGSIKSEIMPNQWLAEELDKPIIRKF